MDFELAIGWRVMAAVSGIGAEPFDRIADALLDRRNDAGSKQVSPTLKYSADHHTIDGQL
jgi:hypothetical protein